MKKVLLSEIVPQYLREEDSEGGTSTDNGSATDATGDKNGRLYDKVTDNNRYLLKMINQHLLYVIRRAPEKVCTWWHEICSCSCLTLLPGLAWVLLDKICILFTVAQIWYLFSHFVGLGGIL